MANNALIYNAALAGAAGGAKAERWITSAVAATYTPDRNAAAAFASAVDSAIPNDPAMNTSKAQLIQTICQAVMQSRAFDTEDITSNTALAAVALYNSMVTVAETPLMASVGVMVERLNFNIVGNATTVAILPAGHQPGLYSVGMDAILRAAGTAGSMNRQYNYTSPTQGLVSTPIAGYTLNTTLGKWIPTGQDQGFGFIFRSTGVTAINAQLNPAGGAAGTPIADLYFGATLIALAP